VLASTDPVAVSALGRRLSLPPRVQALVQAELARLYDNGTISAVTRQQLQRSLDLETTRLSEPR
jgi:hypothetical protein